MKIAIIYASRYGSTGEISEWIAQRFSAEGFSADAVNVNNAELTGGHDLVLLGSGIYSHKFLPEMESFITENVSSLSATHSAIFGVAMQTEPVLMNGKAVGGITMLTKYACELGSKCIGGTMLHGEMVHSRMTDEDKEGLNKFYTILNLSPEELKKRKSPRTTMNKTECWDFAEKLIAKINRGIK
ncbi:Flavodoxin-like protein [Denitrovibrio acetiphilus DSM 12809]|jgi:menaquinone-dependent protoporphyrinogen oxidase|uniref:Flavodoxin-like protein n=1 Tax=Denitrovibrio acetiphilus (strain DSM 12809 / NBRC 114555 / N2460) TaxID=522772 RepID=D4H5I4_DENA2|nr:flavodoxin-like protein [Denitrovibrio acetiphilus]ADD67604.1 Flavodoxin-like protein [Denitrovibrio acetiphilus DSM 12809]